MKQRVGSGLFAGVVWALAGGCGSAESGTPNDGNPSATATAGMSSPSSSAGSQASAGAKAGPTTTPSAGTGGKTGTTSNPVTSTAGSTAVAGSTAIAGANASAGTGGASATAGASASAGKGGSGAGSAAGSSTAAGGAANGGCGSESFAAIYDSIFKNTTYNCTGALCHGREPAMAMPVGNLSLSSAAVAYMQLVKVNSTSMACSGKARVTPGDATGSLLVQKLRGANTMCGAAMPVGADEITDTELKRITDWISAGACNN